MDVTSSSWSTRGGGCGGGDDVHEAAAALVFRALGGRAVAAKSTTPFEHREEIKAAYGLREFSGAEAEFAQWARSRSNAPKAGKATGDMGPPSGSRTLGR